MFVFLTLDKAPVAGEPVSFIVKVTNKQTVAKVMKVHLNAQAKEYNHSPSDTFWESHGVVELAPREGKFTFHSSTDKSSLLKHCWGLNVCPFLLLCLSSQSSSPADPPSPV